MNEVDFWGLIFPTWLAGIGGLAAAIIGLIALLKSLKNEGGVRTLTSAANAASSATTPPAPAAPPSAPAPGAPAPAAVAASPVSWTTWQESRGKYRLRNDSTIASATAELTGFKDVTPGGDNAAAYNGTLPVTLAPSETVPFNIDKTFVSPSVTAIELTWNDPDGTPRTRNIYV